MAIMIHVMNEGSLKWWQHNFLKCFFLFFAAGETGILHKLDGVVTK